MRDILLVGCGNIGFRHLQALANSDQTVPGGLTVPGGVTVVEPNLAHHPRISAALDALPPTRRQASRVLTALPETGGDFALAVFATNSADRRAAYEAARGRVRLSTVVFEKVLFPRLRDLDEVGADLAAAGIAAWVNCPRRAAPEYRRLRERLAGRGPVHLEVTGSSYGLGSNAIHFLDLAEYLNRAPLAALDASGLLPGSAPSKRPGYVEIFGVLSARLDNDAEVTLCCGSGNRPGVAITLRSAEGRLAIDEAAQQARRLPDGPAERFEMRHVSELTAAYASLLDGDGAGFSPYAESARQHRHLLAGILSHLGLAVAPDTACPIS